MNTITRATLTQEFHRVVSAAEREHNGALTIVGGYASPEVKARYEDRLAVARATFAYAIVLIENQHARFSVLWLRSTNPTGVFEVFADREAALHCSGKTAGEADITDFEVTVDNDGNPTILAPPTASRMVIVPFYKDGYHDVLMPVGIALATREGDDYYNAARAALVAYVQRFR